jgi:hypothetical protein
MLMIANRATHHHNLKKIGGLKNILKVSVLPILFK